MIDINCRMNALLNDVADYLKTVMINKHIHFDDTQDSKGIILQYYNCKNKIISAKSRKVIISKELQKQIHHKKFVDGETAEENNEISSLLNSFIHKIETGADLIYNQSRRIFSADFHDIINNHWNIKHIHLDDTPVSSKTGMKKNRSKWLLFLALDDKNAYLFCVRKHMKAQEFTMYSFLEIAENNDWMEQIGFKLMEGVTNAEPIIKDNDTIYKLYENNINLPFQFKNKVYFPFGTAMNGDQTITIVKCNWFCNEIRTLLSKYINVQFVAGNGDSGKFKLRCYAGTTMVLVKDFNLDMT